MNKADENKILRYLKRDLDKPYWKGIRILDENMELIRTFDGDNKVRQRELSTRLHYVKHLKAAAAMLGKPFRDVAKEDMVKFIAEYMEGRATKTVNNMKIAVKRFYQWLCGIEDEYPPVVKWMKPAPLRNTIKPEHLLDNDERERLLVGCRCQRDRAIIMMIDELGPRPDEVLSMKVGDVTPNRYGMMAMLNGKTGARPAPIIDAAPDMQLWLNQHPLRDDVEAPLWVYVDHGEVKPLTYNGLRGVLRRIVKRAGIKRRIWLYLYRHSRRTEEAKLGKGHLPEAVQRKLAGWTASSRMPGVYHHLAGGDVEAAILRSRGIELEEPEEERRLVARSCPRCGTRNPPDAKYCMMCSLVLDREEALRFEDVQNTLDDVMSKLFEDPEFRDIVAKKMADLGINRAR